jgi:hypothetical protein
MPQDLKAMIKASEGLQRLAQLVGVTLSNTEVPVEYDAVLDEIEKKLLALLPVIKELRELLRHREQKRDT